MKSIRSLTLVEPSPHEDNKLSERGYFWIGCVTGIGSAVGLYCIIRLVHALWR